MLLSIDTTCADRVYRFENFFNKRDVSVSGNGFASSTVNGVTETAGDPAVAAQVAAQIQAAFGNIPGFENFFNKRFVSVSGNGFASSTENGVTQTAGDPAVAAQVQAQLEAAFGGFPGFENLFNKRFVSVSGNGFASSTENGVTQTAGDPAVAAQVQAQLEAAFGNLPGFENFFNKREVSVSGNGFASSTVNGVTETAGDPAVAAQVQAQLEAAFGNIPGFENFFAKNKREVSVSGNGFASSTVNGVTETAGDPAVAAQVQAQLQVAFGNIPGFENFFSKNKREVSVSGNGFASSTVNGVTETAGDPAVAAQVAAQIQAAFGNIPGFENFFAKNKRDVSVSGNGFASSTVNGVTETAGDPAVAAQVQAQLQAAFGNIPG